METQVQRELVKDIKEKLVITLETLTDDDLNELKEYLQCDRTAIYGYIKKKDMPSRNKLYLISEFIGVSYDYWLPENVEVNIIDRAMWSKGLTDKDLSNLLGGHYLKYQRYISGETRPDFETAYKICNLLDLDLKVWVKDTEEIDKEFNSLKDKKFYNIGNYIGFLMKEKNLTINQLVEVSGLNRRDIRDWINGKVDPSENSLFILAKTFRLPYNWFVGLTDIKYSLLAEARLKMGYTRQDLACRCGISDRNLRDYEMHTTFPTREVKNRLLRELDGTQDLFPMSLYDWDSGRYFEILEKDGYNRKWLVDAIRNYEVSRDF